MKNIFIRSLLFSGLSMGLTFGYAQKKSDAETNIWASTPYKIDGKIFDWGDSLRSYNSASKLFYAIANDDQNLYLAIKSSDAHTISRIIAGGISFTVNPEGKKKAGSTITFPVIARSPMRSQQARPQNGGNTAEGQTDNRTELARKALATAKEIKVEGIKTAPDGGISIYNEYGIKAVSSIDDKQAYIYELSIPIKLLNLPADKSKELAFQIKTNGLEMPQSASGGYGDRGGMSGGNYGGSGYSNRMGSSDMGTLFQSTDFWIKQSLAIK